MYLLGLYLNLLSCFYSIITIVLVLHAIKYGMKKTELIDYFLYFSLGLFSFIPWVPYFILR